MVRRNNNGSASRKAARALWGMLSQRFKGGWDFESRALRLRLKCMYDITRDGRVQRLLQDLKTDINWVAYQNAKKSGGSHWTGTEAWSDGETAARSAMKDFMRSRGCVYERVLDDASWWEDGDGRVHPLWNQETEQARAPVAQDEMGSNIRWS